MIIKKCNKDVIITTDFLNIERTLDCGQSFRFTKTSDGKMKGIVNSQIVECSQKENQITFYNMNEKQFNDYYYNYFAFDLDYSQIIDEFCKDETLKIACQKSQGIRVLKQDKFETVCSFIISQNNNIPRIKGIIDRFCVNFGKKISDDNYSFPKVNDLKGVTVDDLAPLRAGFRAKYIVDAVEKISNKEINLDELEKLDYETAKQTLMKIKGIGPKVADCVLLFSCAQYEAFPMDVWMKRVMNTLYPNGLPDCAQKYKGIAQQFLFDYARSIDLK